MDGFSIGGLCTSEYSCYEQLINLGDIDFEGGLNSGLLFDKKEFFYSKLMLSLSKSNGLDSIITTSSSLPKQPAKLEIIIETRSNAINFRM